MKKISAFILSMILVLSLCACDSGKGTGNTASASDLTQAEIDAIIAEMDEE